MLSQSNCDDSESESGRGEREGTFELGVVGDGINHAPNDFGGEDRDRVREGGRGVDDESGKGLINIRDARTHEDIIETSLCKYLYSSMSSSGTAPPFMILVNECNGTIANLRKIADAQRKWSSVGISKTTATPSRVTGRPQLTKCIFCHQRLFHNVEGTILDSDTVATVKQRSRDATRSHPSENRCFTLCFRPLLSPFFEKLKVSNSSVRFNSSLSRRRVSCEELRARMRARVFFFLELESMCMFEALLRWRVAKRNLSRSYT